jgi:hypothetical protein
VCASLYAECAALEKAVDEEMAAEAAACCNSLCPAATVSVLLQLMQLKDSMHLARPCRLGVLR